MVTNLKADKARALEKDHSRGDLRVLVVEDETLIALLLEDMLTELGAALVGPFVTLAAALEAARRDDFDIALIDMNLSGERADDVARLLVARGTPFALVSGDHHREHSLGQAAVLQKPFTFSDIAAVLQQLSDARGQSRG